MIKKKGVRFIFMRTQSLNKVCKKRKQNIKNKTTERKKINKFQFEMRGWKEENDHSQFKYYFQMNNLLNFNKI